MIKLRGALSDFASGVALTAALLSGLLGYFTVRTPTGDSGRVESPHIVNFFVNLPDEAVNWEFTVYLPNRTSFRQAAVAEATLEFAGERFTEDLQRASAGKRVCAELLASSFEVAPNGIVCQPLPLSLNHREIPPWTWSLYPRADVAGDQDLRAMAAVVGEDSPTTTEPLSRPVYVEATLTVSKGFLDKYPTLAAAFLATLMGAGFAITRAGAPWLVRFVVRLYRSRG